MVRLLQEEWLGVQPWGWGQRTAEGNTIFSWAPVLGRISGDSLHLGELSAALGNFIHHGPTSCFSLLPSDPIISTGLGGGEMGKSEKQSSSRHLVTVCRYGGFPRAAWGRAGLRGADQDEGRVWSRCGGCAGRWALWQLPLPSAPSRLWPLHLERAASRPLA